MHSFFYSTKMVGGLAAIWAFFSACSTIAGAYSGSQFGKFFTLQPEYIEWCVSTHWRTHAFVGGVWFALYAPCAIVAVAVFGLEEDSVFLPLVGSQYSLYFCGLISGTLLTVVNKRLL